MECQFGDDGGDFLEEFCQRGAEEHFVSECGEQDRLYCFPEVLEGGFSYADCAFEIGQVFLQLGKEMAVTVTREVVLWVFGIGGRQVLEPCSKEAEGLCRWEEGNGLVSIVSFCVEGKDGDGLVRGRCSWWEGDIAFRTVVAHGQGTLGQGAIFDRFEQAV